MPPISHILYLHGFRSSPLSTKARMTHAWVQAHRPDLHWWCPQLPGSPAEALQLVMDGIAAWPTGRMAVIGSSLGGFYATAVAERTGCRAVLLNPAVDPARDLVKYLGEQPAWHDPSQVVEVRLEHMDELRAIAPAAITHPERYFVVIAKGDEVLDWREMHARYAGCSIRLLEGSDHALSDYDQDLPHLTRFLNL
ncbi:YqiA/YcfP family alpha/beta fold hydrolase [Ideonella alba]|uniref:Esterase n=1 Tax=Ideonella alba TaxID=2824118 RepID=A0A940Y7Y8_9BURK|nr:YqiA/YcfP family alpha/beta fold hydrolase [Ideonella alba]MBQ0930493.1 esterase [Ideonella alba]